MFFFLLTIFIYCSDENRCCTLENNNESSIKNDTLKDEFCNKLPKSVDFSDLDKDTSKVVNIIDGKEQFAKSCDLKKKLIDFKKEFFSLINKNEFSLDKILTTILVFRDLESIKMDSNISDFFNDVWKGQFYYKMLDNFSCKYNDLFEDEFGLFSKTLSYYYIDKTKRLINPENYDLDVNKGWRIVYNKACYFAEKKMNFDFDLSSRIYESCLFASFENVYTALSSIIDYTLYNFRYKFESRVKFIHEIPAISENDKNSYIRFMKDIFNEVFKSYCSLPDSIRFSNNILIYYSFLKYVKEKTKIYDGKFAKRLIKKSKKANNARCTDQFEKDKNNCFNLLQSHIILLNNYLGILSIISQRRIQEIEIRFPVLKSFPKDIFVDSEQYKENNFVYPVTVYEINKNSESFEIISAVFNNVFNQELAPTNTKKKHSNIEEDNINFLTALFKHGEERIFSSFRNYFCATVVSFNKHFYSNKEVVEISDECNSKIEEFFLDLYKTSFIYYEFIERFVKYKEEKWVCPDAEKKSFFLNLKNNMKNEYIDWSQMDLAFVAFYKISIFSKKALENKLFKKESKI